MADNRRRESTGPSGETESYVVGQVADSLFQRQTGQDKATPLLTLFTTTPSAVQPVFSPVLESKVSSSNKRKLAEDESDAANKAKQQKPEKRKGVRQKQLTAAQRKVAQREKALSVADEEGEGEGCRKRTGTGGQSPAAPALPAKNTTEPNAKKSAPNPALERTKNRRTLFVGNLPWECSKQMITAVFKEFGPIESVRFRSVARADTSISRRLATIQRKVHPKRNNMNAYVVFEQDGDAARALSRNGCEIQTGFHIRVDLANKSNIHDHRRSVFLGNLSYEIGEEEVRGHFCECGEIESVRIVRDRDSGMGKGFGYVLFQSTDAVTLAMELNNSELKGRRVRVSHSVKKESSPQDPASQGRARTEPGLAVTAFSGIAAEGGKTRKKKVRKSKPSRRKAGVPKRKR
uniref:RNA-binding protein 34 n=1 Tax=Pristiophorus japonicus TaxID=55135 RepID=UPI00398ECFB8